MGPTWGQPGTDRTQVGPCWPHDLCYLGILKPLRCYFNKSYNHYQGTDMLYLSDLHTPLMLTRTLFQEQFFPSQFKFNGKFILLPPSCREVIAIKFCTWHDDCGLLTKFCNGMMPENGVTLRLIFHPKNVRDTGPSIPDGTRNTVAQMFCP